MITVYATKEDYSKLGFKELLALEDAVINDYLELASIDINKATLTRIEKKGFNNLTENQKYLIMKATCEQAEYIKEEGRYDDLLEVSSFSIAGELTINENGNKAISTRLELSSKACAYLKRTGLTSRIIWKVS